MRRFAALLAALVLGCAAAPASAHPAPFSYLDLRLSSGAVEATVVVHVLDVAYELKVPEGQILDPRQLPVHVAAIERLLRERVRLEADGRVLDAREASAPEPVPDRDGIRVRLRYPVDGLPARLGVQAYMFPYDPVHQTFVNVYEGDDLTTQAILGKDRQTLEYFTGTRQGIFAVARRFVASGIHHILIGPDHILFLVGLLLLGGTLKRLALVVTAFTAAHSVTLSLAALNILDPPAWVIEPAIALSIVYVGADNLTVRGGRDVRAWIAFAFGLIHGFGFANVLREMDLPPRALGWSLFSFNVGVEIGQLAVVLVVASILAMIRRHSETAGRRIAVGGSIAVIAAGAFWFVERVFFSGA